MMEHTPKRRHIKHFRVSPGYRLRRFYGGTYRPDVQITAEILCTSCGERHEAAFPAECDVPLECPSCGAMACVVPIPTSDF